MEQQKLGREKVHRVHGSESPFKKRPPDLHLFSIGGVKLRSLKGLCSIYYSVEEGQLLTRGNKQRSGAQEIRNTRSIAIILSFYVVFRCRAVEISHTSAQRFPDIRWVTGDPTGWSWTHEYRTVISKREIS